MYILNYLISLYLLSVTGTKIASYDTPSIAWHRNIGVTYCSPAVGNILDAYPGSEIVIGNDNAEIFCFSASGILIWYRPFRDPLRFVAPALADIDNDGTPEVIIHSRSDDSNGELICLTNNGTPKWSVTTHNYRYYAGLTVANIDTQQTPEILVGSSSCTLYCVNSSGDIDWTYPAGDFMSSPAIANIDEDGTPEIITGSDDGYIRCLDESGNLKWERWIGVRTRFIAISDVDLDGEPEIIASANLTGRNYVFCIKSDGEIKWQKLFSEGTASGISMAAIDDINKDSYPEIVVFSNSYTESKDSIFVLQDAGDSARVIWSVGVADWSGGSRPPPIISDVDGNGIKEVIWEGTQCLRIYDGSNGSILYENFDFCSGTCAEHPAIADIDGDGHAEIIAIYGYSEVAVLECDEWTKCRDQFSSYNYHITNINDDLSVPRIEPNLWETHNSWLAQGFLPGGYIIIRPDQSDSTLPDSTIEYSLEVINKTDSTDYINITISGTQPDWKREIYDETGIDTIIDNNDDGIPDIGLLPSNDTAEIVVKITPPPDAICGVTDTTMIKGSLSLNPDTRDHAFIVTKVARIVSIGVVIEPSSCDSIYPGETARYYLWVRNEGNQEDCIDIKAEGSWNIVILDPSGEDSLRDTDDDGFVDLGEIIPEESRGFFVDITPPVDLLVVDVDTTLIYAVSSLDTSVRDSVSLITKLLGDIGIIIEPNIEAYVRLGDTNEYLLTISTVNVGDTVSLFITPSPDGWIGSLYYEDEEIEDTDGDGFYDIGYIAPFNEVDITFMITAPQLIGYTSQTDILTTLTAHLKSYPLVCDSVSVITHLRVELDVYNYESPFKERTMFVFSLPENGDASLYIYNRVGEMVRKLIDSRYFIKGIYTEEWDGTNDSGEKVSPGVYIYVFEVDNDKGETDRLIKKTILKE